MPTALPLTDQVFIITGGGTGLGAALAQALVNLGAHCVLTGRRERPLRQTAEKLGPLAHPHPADLTDVAQAQAVVAETANRFGRLDSLVNNAGVFEPKPFPEITLESFDRTLNVNLRSVFVLCQAAWPHLIASRGQIINISSVAGLEGYPGSAAYAASKFALNGLTEVLALEGEAHGIRAVAVCPAQIATPLWEQAAPPEVLARMMTAEQVAALVAHIITAPRNLKFDPVVVRNFTNPWAS